MAKIIFLFIAIVHGLIHFLGFIKAYNLAPVEQLQENISKPAGLFWLLAGLLFLGMTVLYLLKHDIWWIVGIVAIIISQILIVLSWSDAKYGSIANLLLAIPIILALMGRLPR